MKKWATRIAIESVQDSGHTKYLRCVSNMDDHFCEEDHQYIAIRWNDGTKSKIKLEDILEFLSTRD